MCVGGGEGGGASLGHTIFVYLRGFLKKETRKGKIRGGGGDGL